MIGRAPLSATAVDRTLDLRFASPGGHDLFADLYLPRTDAKRRPVVMWLHGGGWTHGDRKLAPDLGRHFACRGFAAISIDYRLTAAAVFPAQVEDVKTAIRWVRTIADTYSLNADAIGLVGSSAGGHLAAIAGLAGEHEFQPADAPYAGVSSRVHAVVDAYGPVDFLTMDEEREHTPADVDADPESVRMPPAYRSAGADSFESRLIGAPIASRPDLIRRASPLTYVSEQPAVPFLILHGRGDSVVPPAQSRHLYDRLAAARAEVTFCLVAGLGHGFLNRTHLDDGGPRNMRVRSSHADGSVTEEERRAPVFETVAEFLAAHLV